MTRAVLLACLDDARALGLACAGVPYRRRDGKERWWAVLYDRQGTAHYYRTRWQFRRACADAHHTTWRFAHDSPGTPATP